MFKYEDATVLLYLIGVPILAILLYLAYRYRRRQLSLLGDRAVLSRILPSYHQGRYLLKKAMLPLAIAMAIIAWANPQWGTRAEKVEAETADIYIAFDISQSMMAQDIAPDRLTYSKQWLLRLVDALAGYRIGLIHFAGTAYTQMPLSTDIGAAKTYITSATPSQVSAQGTNISEAVKLAARKTDDQTRSSKALIIVSDGEDHDQDAISAVEAARKEGVTTYTVAVGTEAGAPIPYTTPRGGKAYKEVDGQQVISRVDLDYLQEMAQKGGGRFYLINDGKAAIDNIVAEVNKLEKRKTEEQVFTTYNSYFQVFLGLAFLCLLLYQTINPIKKPVLALLVLLCGGSLSAQSVHQQLRSADAAYRDSSFAESEILYRQALAEDPAAATAYNLGNTLYQQQRYDEAADQYSRAAASEGGSTIKADALHNLGNAYYEQQAYGEAINAYKQALQYDPSHDDTKANLLQAKMQLQQQQQQQQQSQDQQNKDQENQEEEQQQDQQQQENPENEENQDQDQSQQQESEDQPNDKEQQEQQPKPSDEEINKQDAENLLRIAKQEEQKVQEKLRKAKGKGARQKKDW